MTELSTYQPPDLRLAIEVQRALLTGEVPDCHCGRMVLKNRMSNQLGGDFYHFRELGRDQIAFAIGDVMGHSISSALLMGLIMGHLKADHPDQRRPSRVVGTINELLLQMGDKIDYPVTCSLIYGVVDLPSGLLLYVNAGHPHPIVNNRRSGRSRILPPTTMLLGVRSDVMSESCHQFLQSDRLVLFTDGLSEARNDEQDMLGAEVLLDLVRERPKLSPDELTDHVFDHVDKYRQDRPQDDDETIVVIDFDEVSQEH